MAAADAGEVDLLCESLGDFVYIMVGIGRGCSATVAVKTVVIRTNQLTEIDGQRPYADAQVRRALTMAVSDAICLDLGYAGLGDVAETHHMCPIHPEYADLPAPVSDPEQAEAMMAEAEHELISIDETTGAARSAIPLPPGCVTPVSR